MSVTLINVVGTVRDVQTGQPIIGVTVSRMIGTNPQSYVQTGPAGTFNIPIATIDGLRFTHAEYQAEDYTSGQLFANENVIYMVRKNTTLPPVLASRNFFLLTLAAGLGVVWYVNRKKK